MTNRIQFQPITRAACLFALLAVAFPSSDALAVSSPPVTFQVTGNVTANCSISVLSGISFTYDPVGANASSNATATGQLSLACTKGSAPSITLDAGLHAGQASVGPRAMQLNATNYLGYDIYWPGTTTSWTLANPYVPSAPTSKAARTINMDGVAFSGQDVAVGNGYADTVTAIVNF